MSLNYNLSEAFLDCSVFLKLTPINDRVILTFSIGEKNRNKAERNKPYRFWFGTHRSSN